MDDQKIVINSLAIKKLISPQPGKVNTQVSTMSFTTPKLMADSRLTAPTPMIALVLEWLVETGMPNKLYSSRQNATERSAATPWYFSSRKLTIQANLIIF